VRFSRYTALIDALGANVLCGGIAASQQTGAISNELLTQTIVASFNKSKHLVKEKHGVRKEKYLDVRSAPAVKPNPADYSGTYEASTLGFSLELRVDRSGKVEGKGYEPLNGETGVSRSFTLINGQITGALIKAAKVYPNGSSDPFEGVFINKTTFESPTDRGETTFGLGVVGKGFQAGGVNIDKIFYELKE
jgi:hypothetical protein